MTDTPDHPQYGFADDARRYRLDSRIATGGMGEVWRATDTVLGREVAVKLLKAEYADDPTFRTRFETEARHAASLHHPNVAAVYDFGEAERSDGSGTHRPYLVMEVVDGQPLSALLRGGEPLDPDATRDLLAQAADAIGAAHAVGIVHRDVKPANLLVTPDRQVKITDFGIARAAEGIAMTETGQVMGTPQYLSPEQARGETATPASDVYSLGVVAFECLAGRRPFVADTAIATALAHLREPVPELPAGVPADLAAVVRKALAKSPGDRFPDAAALAVALRDPATAATAIVAVPPTTGDHTQVLPPVAAAGAAGAAAAGPPTTATPIAPAHSAGDRRRRAFPWLIIVVALLLAAVVVFALVATGGGDEPTAPDPGRTGKPSKSASQSQEPSQEPSSQSPSAPESSASSSAPTTPSSSAPTTAPTETPTVSPSGTPADTTSPSVPASAPASASPSPSRAPTSSPTASRAPSDHDAERSVR